MKIRNIGLGLILVLSILASLVGTIRPTTVSAAGWLSGWANRIKITVNQTYIDANLTNFPVFINLSSSSGLNSADLSSILTNLGSDANRKKVAVTTADGTTQCYAEIETWNTASRQAALWVRVPAISGSANTDLYLYFDRNHADNNSYVGDKGSSAARQVWDSNYKLVMHLNDGNDSTQYNRNGSYKSGTPQVTDGVAGGSSLRFNSGPYLEIPSTNDFSVDTNGGRLLISFWFSPNANPMTSGEYTHFISKIDDGKGEWAFRYYNNTGSASPPFNASNRRNAISFYYWNNSGGLGSGARWDRGPLPANSWAYVTAAADLVGDTFYIYGWPSEYKSGKVTGSGGYWNFSGSPQINPNNAGAPIRLAYCPGRPVANCRIDEFRISNSLRSDAWVKADYYTQSDKLLTFGTIESSGSSSPAAPPTTTQPITTPEPTPTPTPAPAPTGSAFGLSSGNITYDQFGNALQAMRFQNTCGSGTLTKLELLVNDSTPSGRVRLGVYADNNGKPGNLLLDAGEVNVDNGWVSVSKLKLPVANGQYYWLTYNLQSQNVIRGQSGQPSSSHYRVNGHTYGALPSSFPSGALVNNSQYVIRATVSAGQTNPEPTPTPAPAPAPTTSTFGLNSGGSTYSQFGNALQAMRFQNTCGSGTLTKLELLVNDSTPSGRVGMGVYADNNGKPGKLLLNTSEVSVRNGWVSVSNLKLPVTNNSYYWLAYNLQSTNGIAYRGSYSSGCHYRINNTSYGTWPSTFPNSALANNNAYIMRATINR
ncbi:MAG: hypothetical protein PHU23_06075 [Dehalococcoidales bacterium]|nr:hypothetical protein [Dehalococcoidales bacterium]